MKVATTDPTPFRTSRQLQGGDTLRVVATLGVILIHVAMRLIDPVPSPGSIFWWTVGFLEALARWSVPVFVLLSGALLLDPAKDETSSLFYRKRIRRIGIPVAVWSIGYLALDFLIGDPLGGRELIWRIVTGTPYYHLWFLYMIVGLYGVTPFLRIFVRHATNAQRWGLVALLLVSSVGQDAFHALTSDNEAPFILTRFVPFLGYYLCGYQFRTLETKLKAWSLISIIMICAVLMVVGSYLIVQWFGYHRGGYLYGYASPLVVISSLTIFFWATKASPIVDQDHGFARFIRHVSACTLGIYLVHPLVIGGLHRVGLDIRQTYAAPGILLLTLFIFTISYGVVVMMKRVPILRQTV